MADVMLQALLTLVTIAADSGVLRGINLVRSFVIQRPSLDGFAGPVDSHFSKVVVANDWRLSGKAMLQVKDRNEGASRR